VLLCYIHSTKRHFMAALTAMRFRKSLINWRPQGDSNPRYRRERAGDLPHVAMTWKRPCAVSGLFGASARRVTLSAWEAHGLGDTSTLGRQQQ
jgi:ribosomal protein L32E